MSPFSPAYDNKIARKYSARTLEEKAKNKGALQQELGWVEEPKRPIVCISTGMTDALGGKLLTDILPGLLELPVSLVILGRGSEKYGKTFTQLEKEQKHRVRILPDDETSLRKMLAGSDIALFLTDKGIQEDTERALRYGVVPVAQESKLLENYNPIQEAGNAFIFEEGTVWQSFAALVRALETFKFPYDWRTIQRHAMESIEE